MTAQILATELGNLISESKRKHTELRNAAEKSLDELKGLRSTSEAQIAADLAQRPNFITPFLIACSSKNAKYTGIAIVCLQRLVVSRALPKSRLREVLEAFREATSAGLDVQLKILQALPSLLQNYADELKGELLATSLNICTILQASKNGIVNNTAAATLQQLVVSVFDKVVVEDKVALEVPTVGEAPVEDGTIQLRAASLDAYRVFNDLCLLTESQKPKFLRSTGLPQTFGLELIESVLTNHAQIFLIHPEQANILRIRVMPFIISSLSEKLNFAVTVRIVRILFTLIRNHLSILKSEGEMALSLLTHMLDHDTALWKRSLCMEALRGIFADASLIRRIYAMYDSQESRKAILRDLVAAFVRLSTEKPSVIGLGSQSTIPVANSSSGGSDQAMLEASGVPGIISSSVGSSEPAAGISTQWSTIRVPCIDQLDKTEPPSIPESYIYSLALACVSGFSEGLAKFILPLTVPDRPRKKGRQTEMESKDSANSAPSTPDSKPKMERRTSTKKNPMPVNPLNLDTHPLFNDIKICAGIVDDCWPAILATCSTFLNAALDQDYYHGLVRSFQKFTHVAGLLRLSTPRDAFLTTLGKAAVPPNLLTHQPPAPAPPATPTSERQTMFQNAKGLLSVDSLVGTFPSERGRLGSMDAGITSLNTRNLLCLRALLNLGIALGPTLDTAWGIILGTLQQADLVLFSSTKVRTPTTPQKGENQLIDNNPLLANFGTEIKAVETAAARLLESTIDFPNEPFVQVIKALCSLFIKEELPKPSEGSVSSGPPSPETRRPSSSHRRITSLNTAATTHQEDLFALAKLGEVASINIGRLMTYEPEVSGYALLSSELVSAACSTSTPASVRLRAAEIIVRLIIEAATATLSLSEDVRGVIQLRLLETLRHTIQPLESGDREMSVAIHSTDIDVHKIVLEGLKSILEQCGETFVSGWDIAFSITGSVFVKNDSIYEGSIKGSKTSTTRSAKLIRSAFSSLQLICSDFLSSLPNSCFIILVDTLYNFCTQDDELNISLTTVTFFWVLSDFISGRTSSFSLSPGLIQGASEEALSQMASGDDLAVSDAALWMLLLLRLTAVTADERLELRNSAIQTLLRIFDAYGDQLTSEAWSICLKSVMFRLLSSIEDQLTAINDPESSVSDKDKSGWNETTVVVLNGITNLLADYLDILSSHDTFGESWQTLLSHFKKLLEFQILEINTAVFKAMRLILSRGNLESTSRTNFDRTALDLAWGLWSHSMPVVSSDTTNKRFDNQNYLLAYVSALQEIYRLIHNDIDDQRVQRMITLLRETIQRATAATYSADIDYLTPLQTQVLESLSMIRTDIDGVPAALIGQVAEFIGLAFDSRSPASGEAQRPTYVALSKASMSLLETLVVSHSSDLDVYRSGALATALSALARPIVLKYSFSITTKTLSPWRQATISALAVLKSVLPVAVNDKLKEDVLRPIWSSVATIGNGITNADCSDVSETVNIKDDQEFDISSFLTLRELITPALGSSVIPDKTRRTYTESLFRMSLIHAPQPQELPQPGNELLAFLYRPRKGRTVDPVPSPRSKMSYICFDELVSLVAVHDGSDARIKLAQAAAPYLILRAGLTIRAYISDQPLRGRMPQPLSQRKELLYILKALVKLRCEPDAIPDAPGVESEGKKHLHRLYPLFAKAVRAAAMDQEVLEWLGKALDEVGMDFGV
ncbi:probable MON2 Peripheral membrane protein with a role in endocytosis and vacuole integrity [Phialocephala subalpina]|uniref:Probable MON2 Peripheral membrane protein with a role in endocytosis and vacuole integrity n=1 Tax=Phialocephala subalpina TaxID=576137 RepID=A0A1L7X7N8_9HELO|nr:probable MON2 Peripheral membrane protein with a role in endocytosis and vacuole integrity [Phialocephala subalpina]